MSVKEDLHTYFTKAMFTLGLVQVQTDLYAHGLETSPVLKSSRLLLPVF